MVASTSKYGNRDKPEPLSILLAGLGSRAVKPYADPTSVETEKVD